MQVRLPNLDLIEMVQRFIVLFTAITVHEFSHGFVAYKLGDPTAKNSGRLTLNPLSHLDPIGAICMVLWGFGWAKPVPINPFYFRNRKRDTALVSLAGPAANILLAFLSTIVYVAFYLFTLTRNLPRDQILWFVKSYGILTLPVGTGIVGFITRTMGTLAYINIGFAVFNLIPFPPLDGSKILGAILPNSTYMQLLRYERIGFPILILLSISGVLGHILNVIITPVYHLWYMFANFLLQFILKFMGGI